MPAQIPSSLVQQDNETRPYWEGLAQGELRIQRCTACQRAVFYPRALCPSCHTEALVWIVASGRGTIYTYTVAHQAFGLFAEETPFIVALVELEEGVRLMSRIVGTAPARVAVGLPVQVTFEVVGELTLPYFRLVT